MNDNAYQLKGYYCLPDNADCAYVKFVKASNGGEAVDIVCAEGTHRYSKYISAQELDGKVILAKTKDKKSQYHFVTYEEYNSLKEKFDFLLGDVRFIEPRQTEVYDCIRLEKTFSFLKDNYPSAKYDNFVQYQNEQILKTLNEFVEQTGCSNLLLTGTIAAWVYGLNVPVFDIDLYVRSKDVDHVFSQLHKNFNEVRFTKTHTDGHWKGSTFQVVFNNVAINISSPYEINGYKPVLWDIADLIDTQVHGVDILTQHEYINILKAKSRPKDLERIDQLQKLPQNKE